MSLPEAFQRQSESCAALGSPFMGQLMRLMAERLTPDRPLTKAIFDLPGALGPEAASIPLRLAAALHAVRLQGDTTLAAAYPPRTVSDDLLWEAVDSSLTTHADFISDFLKSPPQTNEVRRATCMIAAANWLHSKHPLPLVISELGASAGLNLMFDRMAVDTGSDMLGARLPVITLTPDWQGKPLPFVASPVIAQRRGVDLSPVDANDPEQKQRLLAYLWPDQPERLARTEAILRVLDAHVDAGDAAGWLEARQMHHPGHLHLIYHTIAWQYFPDETQARAQARIEQAGAEATEDTPLAWLSMEWDGDQGAAMTLRLWPGNRTIALGRIDFHGRWINWDPKEE